MTIKYLFNCFIHMCALWLYLSVVPRESDITREIISNLISKPTKQTRYTDTQITQKMAKVLWVMEYFRYQRLT